MSNNSIEAFHPLPLTPENYLIDDLTAQELSWFWLSVTYDKSKGCWLWPVTPYSFNEIYGHFRLRGKLVSAHRLSFVIFHHPLPHASSNRLGQSGNRMVVDHKCKIKQCVNPEHLEYVTQSENVRRGGIFPRMTKQQRAAAGLGVVTIAEREQLLATERQRQSEYYERLQEMIRVSNVEYERAKKK